jgi:hypothetical protein
MSTDETIEEAACKALGYDYNDWVSLFSKDKSTVIYSEVTNWCKGAKWQQERSYSEEEQLHLLNEYNEYLFSFIDKDEVGIGVEKEDVVKWFEQFKKKQDE